MAEKTGRRCPSHSPQAAASYVRRSAEAMRAAGAKDGERIGVHSSELRALVQWAERRNKLVPFTYIEQFRRVSDGAEHVVYHDRARNVAIKATHTNRFGHSMDGERLGATPLEYLRRLGWHNVLFGDDILIEGVAFDGEQIEVVTSQPWIVANREDPRPSREEIDAYLMARQFQKAPLSVDAPLYFNRQIGVVIADAHDQNILKDEQGDLSPIDLVIGRPGVALQRSIDSLLLHPELDLWPKGLA